ncbi:MAG: DUF3326 domain-containing protein [Heliobacteriaceae bacterium]|jgi:hypothetical protein|nr:DUF3326 domain-containing protein [Heliobacteriaceae bacterium]
MIGNEKLGAFIVPTGIGACTGGFAGDASAAAREFSKYSKLIVNPNVVNAGCFSGINQNMLYVEGYSLNSFFKGEINLKPSCGNKIGVVFDRAIPQDVLNVHINVINAVKTVYGVNITGYEVTDECVRVKFGINENGISSGSVGNAETLLRASKRFKDADAVALVCFFDNPEEDNPNYSAGIGVDPVGGVEAVISHYISKELKIPCAHSPAFADCQISTRIVNPKSAAEYITPSFLPCVLLGLEHAPALTTEEGISINNLDYLVMPYDALGSTPVYEAVKRGIKVFAVRENTSVLNVTASALGLSGKITEAVSYKALATSFR